MDHLLYVFRQYYNAKQSPLEQIKNLADLGLVRIVQNPAPDSMHSISVLFNNYESFNAYGGTEMEATEEAAKLAFHFLKQSAKIPEDSVVQPNDKISEDFDEIDTPESSANVRHLDTNSGDDVKVADSKVINACDSDNRTDEEPKQELPKQTDAQIIKNPNIQLAKPTFRDLRRINLMNHFISAYQWHQSPIQTMEIAMKSNHNDFQLIYKSEPTPNNPNQLLFTATFTVTQLFTCQASAFDKQEASERAIVLAYGRLIRFSLLFAHFKTIYTTDKSPTQIVDELIKKNSDIIRMKVKTTTPGYCITSILIMYLTGLSASEADEEQSKLAACTKVVHFLNALSEKIHNYAKVLSLLDIRKEKLNEYLSAADTHLSATQYEEELVESQPSEDKPTDTPGCGTNTEPMESIDPYLLKRIELINAFNSVCSTKKSRLDIIYELKRFKLSNGTSINITSDTNITSDQMTYISKVVIQDIGLQFTAFASTKEMATNRALIKALEYLRNLSQLVAEFKAICNQIKSPVKVMAQLVSNHWKAIKVNSSVNQGAGQSDQKYFTVVHLVNVCSFARTGPIESISREAALGDIFLYLKRLAEGVLVNYERIP